MFWFGVFGLIAVQGSHSFQIWRMWRRMRRGSDLRDCSPMFYLALLFGLISYLIYSFSITDWVYIVSNSVGITEIGLSLFLLRKARATN